MFIRSHPKISPKVQLGIRLWSYVREEASYSRKAPIDPFTKEATRPSASQGVPLGGMRSGRLVAYLEVLEGSLGSGKKNCIYCCWNFMAIGYVILQIRGSVHS